MHNTNNIQSPFQNVFICLTPLHFFVAYSLSRSLFAKGFGNSLIILKSAIRYNTKKCKWAKIKFENNSNILEKMGWYVSYTLLFNFTDLGRSINTGARIFIYNENDPISRQAIRKRKETKIILVEEGMGTWNDSEYGNKDYYSNAIIGFPDIFKQNHPNFIGNTIKLEYSEMFSQNNAKDFLEFINQSTQADYQVDILFLGDINEISLSAQEEEEKLYAFFGKLPKKVKILIKPHPRENSEKYEKIISDYSNIKIIENNAKKLPIEIFISYVNPKIVLTPYSSAACYIALIHKEINVFYLYKVSEIGYRNIDMGNVEKALRNCSNVHYPINMLQCIQEMQEIINNKECDEIQTK